MISGAKYFQASFDENLAPFPNQPGLQTAHQNCLENIAVNICQQEKLGFKSFSYVPIPVCMYGGPQLTRFFETLEKQPCKQKTV